MPKSLRQLSTPHRRMVVTMMLEKMVAEADIGATVTKGLEGTTIFIPKGTGSL